MFTYNINQTFLHIGLPEYDLTRQEAIALDYVGDLTGRFDNYNGIPDGHSIRVNVNGGEGFESEAVWESEEDALAVADEIPVGETVSATLTVDENDATIDHHAIITLRAIDRELPEKEKQLHWLIFNRRAASMPPSSSR